MSVYVTDTHSLIWYFTRQYRKLSRRALEAFEQAERGEAFVYLPAVVLREISRHDQLGVIRLNEPFEDWVEALLAQPSF
jgi:PIN domain nuclease of toxin-antitoxin system